VGRGWAGWGTWESHRLQLAQASSFDAMAGYCRTAIVHNFEQWSMNHTVSGLRILCTHPEQFQEPIL
jgi:hypothetical protein